VVVRTLESRRINFSETPCDKNACGWESVGKAVDHAPGFAFRCGSDAAGVDDNEVGLSRVGIDEIAPFAEYPSHCGCLSLVDFASEDLDQSFLARLTSFHVHVF